MADNEQPVNNEQNRDHAVIQARALAKHRRHIARRRKVTDGELAENRLLKSKRAKIITRVRPQFSVPTTGANSEAFEFSHWNETTACEIFLPDPQARKSSYAMASNVNGVIDASDGKQVCIYAMGILCCVNNRFEGEMLNEVEEIGFGIDRVRLPSQAAEYAINLEEIETLDTPQYLAIFGFTLLLLFKTATTQNYNHFQNVRMNALKAAAGVHQNLNVVNPYTLEKAQAVRSILGSSPYVKTKVINMLVDMQNGSRNVNSVCRYVASILEYSEMSAVMFAYETLVATYSKVLTEPRVFNEVFNIAEALELMAHSKFPQYFKYLATPEQAARLERSRFPVLAAVGQKLKSEYMGQTSVRHLLGVKPGMDNIVDDLFGSHKRYLVKEKPNTLDVLVKAICAPAGASMMDDNDPGEPIVEEIVEDEEEAHYHE